MLKSLSCYTLKDKVTLYNQKLPEPEMNYCEPHTFLELPDTIPIIDVRSPSEFDRGHIPGAFNIPLFNDEERAIIGTIYVRSGQADAIEKGYEIANPKRNAFIETARQIAKDGRLRVHCWRGGMRSENMAGLFEEAGIQCTVLTGGYKAYRKILFEDFKNISNLIVIHGPTGSGKTEIIQALCGMGEQVIDLEKMASHRGSAFGNVGLPPQPTTMQFQNDLHASLQQFDPGRPIWIEGESINIGKVYMPATLWDLMNRSPVIRIEMEKGLRVQIILKEYGKYSSYELNESVRKLWKRYGGDRTQYVMELVNSGNLEKAVGLLLDYYDRHYRFSFEKYVKGPVITVKALTPDATVNAGIILNAIKTTSLHAKC